MVDTRTLDLNARVLTLDAVRWSIDALKHQKIHPHFFAYLFLCRCAALGDPEDIAPVWHDFEPYVILPTTQPEIVQEKPIYRPISNQRVSDNSNYWMNNHPAGSYGISSIRNAALRFMVRDGHYRLPPNHGDLARTALLGGQPIDPVPVAGYLLRNHGFDASVSSATELADAFLDHFGFHDVAGGDVAMPALFGTPAGVLSSVADEESITFDWFESLNDHRVSARTGGQNAE